MVSLPDIPKESIEIIHGYEGLGGNVDGLFHPYQGTADKKDVVTIGRGHVLSQHEKRFGVVQIAGADVRFKEGLTLAQVDQLFIQDIEPRYERTKEYMPGAMRRELAAGLSLVYNCESAMATGTPGRAWRLGKKITSAAGFLLYIRSAGKPQLGLWRRRMTEALYMLTAKLVIARECSHEAMLVRSLTHLGVIEEATWLARNQALDHPWLKSH